MDRTIADLIASSEAGDPVAAEALSAALYQELRRMARRELARGGDGLSLGATTLLHEAYLDMAGRGGTPFPDRPRFMAYAARVMRSVIVDHARRKRALKRGGAFDVTTLDTDLDVAAAPDLEALSTALDELAALDPRLAQVVDLKFFCGFSFVEIAAMQGVSDRTVQRDWDKARRFLHGALQGRIGSDVGFHPRRGTPTKASPACRWRPRAGRPDRGARCGAGCTTSPGSWPRTAPAIGRRSRPIASGFSIPGASSCSTIRRSTRRGPSRRATGRPCSARSSGSRAGAAAIPGRSARSASSIGSRRRPRPRPTTSCAGSRRSSTHGAPSPRAGARSDRRAGRVSPVPQPPDGRRRGADVREYPPRPPDVRVVAQALRHLAEADRAMPPADREAIETVLATRYRPVLADPRLYETQRFLALGPADHARAQDILRRHPAGDPGAAEASPAVRALVNRALRDVTPPFGPIALALVVAALVFVALCALVLAVVCRGLSLRLLGFEIVSGRGQPASRLRVLARTAIAWSPMLVPALVSTVAGGIAWTSTGVVAVLVTSLVVLTAGAIVAIVSPARGLQDRLAGTWIVPR